MYNIKVQDFFINKNMCSNSSIYFNIFFVSAIDAKYLDVWTLDLLQP